MQVLKIQTDGDFIINADGVLNFGQGVYLLYSDKEISEKVYDLIQEIPHDHILSGMLMMYIEENYPTYFDFGNYNIGLYDIEYTYDEVYNAIKVLDKLL